VSKSDERVVESALHQTRAAPPSRRPVWPSRRMKTRCFLHEHALHQIRRPKRAAPPPAFPCRVLPLL